MKFFSLLLFCLLASIAFAQAPAAKPITIYAHQVLDGLGHVYKNSTVEIQGSKIVKIHPGKMAGVTFDLGSSTIMPGIIDTHVHISWHFDEDGRAHDPDKAEESEHSLPYGM